MAKRLWPVNWNFSKHRVIGHLGKNMKLSDRSITPKVKLFRFPDFSSFSEIFKWQRAGLMCKKMDSTESQQAERILNEIAKPLSEVIWESSWANSTCVGQIVCADVLVESLPFNVGFYPKYILNHCSMHFNPERLILKVFEISFKTISADCGLLFSMTWYFKAVN